MPLKGDEVEHDVEDDDVSDEEMEEDEPTASGKPKKAYIPGVSRPLKEGEEWDFDPEAYRLFHSFETRLPCLSFDVVNDDLGENRSTFPLTCFLAAGSQGDRPRDNELLIMKLSNLISMQQEEDEEDSDEEEEGESSKDPKLHAAIIPHQGGVNRIRIANLGQSSVCAVWNDQAKVQLWNVTGALSEVKDMEGASRSTKLLKERPLFSFLGHRSEGYALAWSNLTTGALASGDNKSQIHIWKMGDGGQWTVDQRPLCGHTGSIEDVAWSPTEAALLVSCSSDGSIKLWDSRSTPAEACVCTVPKAHESDVNVLSWNSHEPILVSGGDDAALNVWSLKTIQFGEPVARFKHHKGPITSVEWCPHESTTMMASGEDDQVTIWDLAVEAEPGENLPDVPPQLLFVHMGQKEVKEVHFHKQVTGLAVTTALSGFNVFRTINV